MGSATRRLQSKDRDAVAELQVVNEAFSRPTLQLLRGNRSAVQVTVLKIVFDHDRRNIPTDQLHARVEALIGTLRAHGHPVPNGSGKDLCRTWLRNGWLGHYPGDHGEVYELTSHALEALEVVQTLSSDRQLLSESRLAAIVDAVRRQAIEASPDAQPRIDRLNAQIDKLTAERDRLVDGHAPEVATSDRMLEGYFHLIDLIGALPSDFKRVEEEMRALRDSILADLRDDDRPIGDTIDDYLARSEQLLNTAEGRAFEGALKLLRDRALHTQLASDLDVILQHEFTEALNRDEVRAFRGTVAMIRTGLDDVLGQRQRSSQTLVERIRHHDAVRERELASTLRSLRSELTDWYPTARVHVKVPTALLPGRVLTLPHVRERFHDPADHEAPELITDTMASTDEHRTRDEILRQGGPLLLRVRDALLAAAETGDSPSVAEVFDTLDSDLRRPVEVLGIMHLLAQVTDLDDAFAAVDTVRPDGSRRELRLPTTPLAEALAAALGALELG